MLHKRHVGDRAAVRLRVPPGDVPTAHVDDCHRSVLAGGGGVARETGEAVARVPAAERWNLSLVTLDREVKDLFFVLFFEGPLSDLKFEIKLIF